MKAGEWGTVAIGDQTISLRFSPIGPGTDTLEVAVELRAGTPELSDGKIHVGRLLGERKFILDIEP